jgi:hypothetical protein
MSQDWTETDEECLAMRIIQAGGAVLDTTYPWSELDYIQRSTQFAAFSRTRNYLLGWPDNGGLWGLTLNGLIPQDYWEDSLADTEAFIEAFFEAIDRDEEVPQPETVPPGAFDTTKLDAAETMHAYCDELRTCGATFYKIPIISDEAVQCGMFDRNTLKTTWTGFGAWRTADEQRMAPLHKVETVSAISTGPPAKSSCTMI